MKPNLIKIEKLVKSKKAILINNKFVKRTLGFSDMREFVSELSRWGYNTDFTYQITPEDWQRFLKRYLKEIYLD